MLNEINYHKQKLSLVFILLVLLLEGPIRVMLQPDPWLLQPDHWYFEQPSRLLIELSIVLVTLCALFKYDFKLLKVKKTHLSLILGSSLGSLLLFSFLEFAQLQESLHSSTSTIVFWLATGFLIGIGQEFIYRGLLFTSLTKFFSKNISAILTTFAFVIAPLHSIRLWDLYSQGELTIVLFLIGIYVAASFFFQWLRDKSDCVIIPGITHGIGNAITWLAVFA